MHPQRPDPTPDSTGPSGGSPGGGYVPGRPGDGPPRGPAGSPEEPSRAASAPPAPDLHPRLRAPDAGTAELPGLGPRRWSTLARVVGCSPREPILLALSGGADSVLLLHVLAAARPRPRVHAVLVDHGLRPTECAAEARFCRALTAALGVPLSVVDAPVAPGPDLEARAREARYHALAEEALRRGFRTVATGHHADDVLETTLLRWVRGTHLGGLAGLRRRALVPHVGARAAGKEDPLFVVRPLVGLRREEVRELLRRAGLAWREDSSNASRAFTRNRLRLDLLPALEELCPTARENLRAFGRAVESLEDSLAAATAHLQWAPPAHAPAVGACRGGGTLARDELAALSHPLRRRALWRLVLEGTGRAPGRRLLERLVEDVASGRRARHALPAGFGLHLRRGRLVLTPPRERCGRRGRETRAHDPVGAGGDLGELRPGERLLLPDGRSLRAELREVPGDEPVPRDACRVELDAERLDGPLRVRWPRPGDRFRGLGAPGSRPLGRFLADAGVPREDRRRVPLVVSGDELLWVGGVRPSHRARVRPTTRRRLRLVLEGA